MVQRHIRLFCVSAVFAASIFLKSECFAQSTPNPLDKIKFSSEEDKKKFDAIPLEFREKIFSRTPPKQPLTQDQLILGKRLGISSIARHTNVPQDSKEWEYLRNRIMNNLSIERAPAPGHNPPLQHIRFKEGKALPSISEINHEKELIFQRAVLHREQFEKKRKKDVAIKNKPHKPRPVQVLSKETCTFSAIATLPIPKHYLAEGKAVDILFFNDKPPFDVKTAIGASTVLVAFGNEETAAAAAPFKSLKIDCVPFRLRSNGKKVSYAKGALALKNYDANPESTGTYDPTVKKYLEQIGLGSEQK